MNISADDDDRIFLLMLLFPSVKDHLAVRFTFYLLDKKLALTDLYGSVLV